MSTQLSIEAPTQPLFRYRTRAWDGATWLQLFGELDLACSAQIAGAIRKGLAEHPVVVLDLERLEFVDSSGVHTIEDAALEALLAGRRVMLARVPPGIQRILTLTGADIALECFDLAGGAVPMPRLRVVEGGA